MGCYCKFCDYRCFLLRVLRDGRSILLATCPKGMEHDRAAVGQDHTTALNPMTDAAAVEQLHADLRWQAEYEAAYDQFAADYRRNHGTDYGVLPAWSLSHAREDVMKRNPRKV